jgi:hypothetical protein
MATYIDKEIFKFMKRIVEEWDKEKKHVFTYTDDIAIKPY